ncbi:MAG: hypothetical protein AAF417_21610, partial [Pseudomonadota bacterium]
GDPDGQGDITAADENNAVISTGGGTGSVVSLLAAGSMGDGTKLNVDVNNATVSAAASNLLEAGSTPFSAASNTTGTTFEAATDSNALQNASTSFSVANGFLNTVVDAIATALQSNVQGADVVQTGEEIEQEEGLNTSGLQALQQISLVDIEIGTGLPWYAREDVPPADATQAEWDTFIEAVLETYDEADREAVRAEIEAYRELALADLEGGFEEDGEGEDGEGDDGTGTDGTGTDGTGTDGTGTDGTGTDGTGTDGTGTGSPDNAQNEDSIRLTPASGFDDHIVFSGASWTTGGLGFEMTHWRA